MRDIVKFKATLVEKGFSQRPCIDYGEIYFPVLKHDFFGKFCHLLKTAFLNGDIKEELLYMDESVGFKEDIKTVCLL